MAKKDNRRVELRDFNTDDTDYFSVWVGKAGNMGSCFVAESYKELREKVEAKYPGEFSDDDWNNLLLRTIRNQKEHILEVECGHFQDY